MRDRGSFLAMTSFCLTVKLVSHHSPESGFSGLRTSALLFPVSALFQNLPMLLGVPVDGWLKLHMPHKVVWAHRHRVLEQCDW